MLLNLSELGLAARTDNCSERRIHDICFALIKPVEIFQFEAAPDYRLKTYESPKADD